MIDTLQKNYDSILLITLKNLHKDEYKTKPVSF